MIKIFFIATLVFGMIFGALFMNSSFNHQMASGDISPVSCDSAYCVASMHCVQHCITSIVMRHKDSSMLAITALIAIMSVVIVRFSWLNVHVKKYTSEIFYPPKYLFATVQLLE